MHNADAVSLTLKVPPDVRAKLQIWAKQNITSMTAEFTRAVRERAAREQREKAATQ